jgi:hypothetical protein
VIPGFLPLVVNGVSSQLGSVLLDEGVVTGMLLRHLVYPNADNAPFENDPPIALFPKYPELQDRLYLLQWPCRRNSELVLFTFISLRDHHHFQEVASRIG